MAGPPGCVGGGDDGGGRGGCVMSFGGWGWSGVRVILLLAGVSVGCWALVLSGREVFGGVRGWSGLFGCGRGWSDVMAGPPGCVGGGDDGGGRGGCVMSFGGWGWSGVRVILLLAGVSVGCWALVLSGREVFGGVRGWSGLFGCGRGWSGVMAGPPGCAGRFPLGGGNDGEEGAATRLVAGGCGLGGGGDGVGGAGFGGGCGGEAGGFGVAEDLAGGFVDLFGVRLGGLRGPAEALAGDAD